MVNAEPILAPVASNNCPLINPSYQTAI